MKNSVISILGIGGLAVLLFMLIFTSPTTIGPIGVLLFFTTLYATLFGLFTLLMRVFYRLAFSITTFRNKDYMYSAVLAFGPIMILMARSFGAITPWTVSLIIFFIILAEFLVYKRT